MAAADDKVRVDGIVLTGSLEIESSIGGGKTVVFELDNNSSNTFNEGQYLFVFSLDPFGNIVWYKDADKPVNEYGLIKEINKP